MAVRYVFYEGYQLSSKYDAGGVLEGRLPGLRPGWLLGKSMVRRAASPAGRLIQTKGLARTTRTAFFRCER